MLKIIAVSDFCSSGGGGSYSNCTIILFNLSRLELLDDFSSMSFSLCDDDMGCNICEHIKVTFELYGTCTKLWYQFTNNADHLASCRKVSTVADTNWIKKLQTAACGRFLDLHIHQIILQLSNAHVDIRIYWGEIASTLKRWEIDFTTISRKWIISWKHADMVSPAVLNTGSTTSSQVLRACLAPPNGLMMMSSLRGLSISSFISMFRRAAHCCTRRQSYRNARTDHSDCVSDVRLESEFKCLETKITVWGFRFLSPIASELV